MKRPLEHARGLLLKANHDLIAARAILAEGEARDMACFHAQQAVEKSLKALLAANDQEYPLIHDLEKLLPLTGPYWIPSAALAERIKTLSAFAVDVRYDETMIPTHEEAQAALDTAEVVYAAVGQLLPSA
jgi:HEPN domain-containing protein